METGRGCSAVKPKPPKLSYPYRASKSHTSKLCYSIAPYPMQPVTIVQAEWEAPKQPRIDRFFVSQHTRQYSDSQRQRSC